MKLSPSQKSAVDGLRHWWNLDHVFLLWSSEGMGKTTMLREVHKKQGGALLGMKDFHAALESAHPLAMEETLIRLITAAWREHVTVYLDDLDLINAVVGDCSFYRYPRAGLFNSALAAIVALARDSDRRIVFGNAGGGPSQLHEYATPWGFEYFTVEDYAFLIGALVPKKVASKLDFAKIHRFAPRLNAHQLKGACRELQGRPEVTTGDFIEFLRARHMSSNVEIKEVQDVELHDLKGIDDVVASLEANVVLPLLNDDLAAEYGLKPKRGVLLAGPPGTGKTTVGRALARRLKSKFFLIDGTMISGSRDFYEKINRVFAAAEQNTPAIVFIDDGDVLFENGKEAGLYRYLLTKLDGLESESQAAVCVMMTAMNVASLPPALIRSGRIELWLETRLPDLDARVEILEALAARLPPAIGPLNLAELAGETEGFTGSDLKRLIEDGKLLLAYDKVRNLPLRSPTHYFLDAIETVRDNKARYKAAEELHKGAAGFGADDDEYEGDD